jgi:hypothetical protein
LVLKAFQLNSLTDAKVSNVDWLVRTSSPAGAAGTSGTVGDSGHRRPCSSDVCALWVLSGVVSVAVAACTASSAVQTRLLQQSNPCCMITLQTLALRLSSMQQRIVRRLLQLRTLNVTVDLHSSLPAASPVKLFFS